MKIFAKVILALSLGALFNGCAKTDPASGTFSSVYTQTLSKTCIECHKPGTVAASEGILLDFSSQALAYSTLLSGTVQADNITTCSTVKMVTPSTVETSYLAAALFSEYNKNDFAGVTGCVPSNTHSTAGYVSTDAEKSSILEWIRNGAPNN